MPSVEEVFDDDTDLPLPDVGGPSGSRLLEQIGDEPAIDMDRLRAQAHAGAGANPGTFAPRPFIPSSKELGKRPEGAMDAPISPMANMPMGGMMNDLMLQQQAEEARIKKMTEQMGNTRLVTDADEYKGWFTLYPIYYDAKVSTTGGRRVARSKCLWWPQSRQIATACSSLSLQAVHELEKCHPADWKNPGRVKVTLQKDGKFTNPSIKTRAQLYKRVADRLQRQNPGLAADKPSPVRPAKKRDDAKATPSKITTTKSKKSQNPSSSVKKNIHPPIPQRKLPPSAPFPFPPLEERLPINSPAVPLGFVVQSVKREIEQEKANKANAIATGTGPGSEQGQIGQGQPGKGPGKGDGKPKMKRMVVRR